MLLLIFIISIVIIYYIILFSKDSEEKKQRRKDPKNRECLESYTTKKNLFMLYGNYLYENINYFKNISNYEIIKKKIELDFPNYRGGISGFGIMEDFSDFDLLKVRTEGKTRLGKTFQIISISYQNFILFKNEIYNSDYKTYNSEGCFYSDFGNDITTKIFYVELQRAKLYFGLSSGGFNLRNYEGKYDFKSEDGEMYLFTELQVNINSNHTYPHFDIINLRKDISVNEYHEYFNKNLEISKSILNDLNTE